MQRITNVTVTRFEGPSNLCGQPFTGTLAEAEARLGEWASDIDHQCVDKCGFEIEMDGELAYTGRYELRQGDECSLMLHVARFLNWAKKDGHAVNAADLEHIGKVVAALAIA